MQKNTIIYIAGLGHSGSTILDLILGCHSDIVGLGEIMPFIRRKDRTPDLNSTCSCGKKGYDCYFWSEVEKHILNSENHTNAYLKLTDYFFNEKIQW